MLRVVINLIASGGDMRVLLGEDHAANAELFRAALEPDGHDVVHEPDGGRAHDRALAEPFDLIVLDLEMPVLRGDEVCRRLRRAGVRTPIVALTASALVDQVRDGLAAGFDRYLTKPIRPHELRLAVRELGGMTG